MINSSIRVYPSPEIDQPVSQVNRTNVGTIVPTTSYPATKGNFQLPSTLDHSQSNIPATTQGSLYVTDNTPSSDIPSSVKKGHNQKASMFSSVLKIFLSFTLLILAGIVGGIIVIFLPSLLPPGLILNTNLANSEIPKVDVTVSFNTTGKSILLSTLTNLQCSILNISMIKDPMEISLLSWTEMDGTIHYASDTDSIITTINNNMGINICPTSRRLHEITSTVLPLLRTSESSRILYTVPSNPRSIELSISIAAKVARKFINTITSSTSLPLPIISIYNNGIDIVVTPSPSTSYINMNSTVTSTSTKTASVSPTPTGTSSTTISGSITPSPTPTGTSSTTISGSITPSPTPSTTISSSTTPSLTRTTTPAPAPIKLVKDIRLGSSSSKPADLFIYANKIIFAANDGINGLELWQSDGTDTGTILLRDIRPGIGGSNPQGFIQFGNSIYFAANDGVSGFEIWKSDGSTANTLLLKDIYPGSASSVSLSVPFVVCGSYFYFVAEEGINGYELWRSNGNVAGTGGYNINPGYSGSYPDGLYVWNNKLFFSANDGSHGGEMWFGDDSGISMLKDLHSGTTSSYTYRVPQFFSSTTTLFFSAFEGQELWKTDGTTAGTIMLIKGITLLDKSRFSSTVFNNLVFFPASPDGSDNTIQTGFELWRTDGTVAGTVLLQDIFPGSSSSFPINLFLSGNVLYFLAVDSSDGLELFKSDSTEDGTMMVQNLNPTGDGFTSSSRFVILGSRLYFSANDGLTGFELRMIE